MTHRPPRMFAGAARGFTLLEVLLATLLMTALMLGLWTLIGIFTRLFETGQSRTEQSQLARALFQQLSDDLHSAIQDPTPGMPKTSRTSTPIRRFSLFGSRHEMRLDVLQLTPLQGNPTPVTDVEGVLTDETAPARVPELRTVFYSFRDPLLTREMESETPIGLTRRELDFETPVASEGESQFEGPPLGEATSNPDILGQDEYNQSLEEATLAEPVDDSLIWVPEVVSLEFRYYSGSGWTSQWNSLQRKSLPVAVEVTMQLGNVDELLFSKTDPLQAAAEESSDELASEDAVAEEGLFADDSTGEQGLESSLPTLPSGPTYRLVIDLPSSPSHRSPQVVRPAVISYVPVTPIPIPSVAPRPRLPRPPAPRVLPDEWMRRGQ